MWRRALSLVELLVVIAIIAILMAILLPAVNSARESARLTSCRNNFRQVGLAVLNYSSTKEFLPSFRATENRFFSWRFTLLPYLEETGLSAGDSREQFRKNAGLVVPVFQCPSTPGSLRTIKDVTVGSFALPEFGAQDIEAGFVGIFSLDPNLISSRAVAGALYGGRRPVDMSEREEMTLKRNRLRRVVDGLSNTILAFERAGLPSRYQVAHAPGDPDPQPRRIARERPCATGNAGAWLSGDFGELTRFRRVKGFDNIINYNNCTGVYSFHPAGANVVNLDASVRFLGEDMSPEVFEKIFTSAGGEVIDPTVF